MSPEETDKGTPTPKGRASSLLGLFGVGRRSRDLTRTIPLDQADSAGVAHTCLPESLRDRYDVQHVLGSGGFGLVLLARDRTIGRLVAVKQLYRHMEVKEQIYSRFLQEARIAGKVSHPNIVTIYTVEEVEGSCCVVMEYLGGGNLGELIQSMHRPLPLANTASIILAVLEGLRTAHAMSVVHRDVKPENILFDNLGTPKISDFGLAHLPMEAGGVDDAGVRSFGTPLYMAPEQLSHRALMDPRSDLYSVGLLLCEMLMGRRLADTATVLHMTDAEELVELPERLFANELDARFGADVRELLDGFLAASPDARFATAATAIDALVPFARGVDSALPGGRSVVHSGRRYATSSLDILRDILELLLTDGILAPAERAELARRVQRLGIDEQTAIQLEEQIRAARGLPSYGAIEEYRQAVEALGPEGISEMDRQSLDATALRLGIDRDEQRTIERYATSL